MATIATASGPERECAYAHLRQARADLDTLSELGERVHDIAFRLQLLDCDSDHTHPIPNDPDDRAHRRAAAAVLFLVELRTLAAAELKKLEAEAAAAMEGRR